MCRIDYYSRPEWSFSQLKHIVKSGIDYAVFAKNGGLPAPASKFIDIGQIVHDEILQQGKQHWVVKAYPNFLTKEAKEWRDAQTLPIIDEVQFEQIASCCEQIKTHPLYNTLLVNNDIQNEKELYAKVNGVSLRGKADAWTKLPNGMVTITDLKTTAKFDDWKYNSFKMHYDLQSSVYSNLSADETDFYFFIAETIKPFRTAVMHVSQEFYENGNKKLATCIEEIVKFGSRKLDFHQNKTLADTVELGDMSW